MGLDGWFDALGGVTHIHGNLYRSPIPITHAHFRSLRDAGIRVVFSMEEAVPGLVARDQGFDWRAHFWTDDAPPQPAQMRAFLDEYLALPDETAAVVQCRAGWGRTGSAVTCALMAKQGWSAQRALEHFWARVPPAKRVMKANGQAEFVRGYAAHLLGRGLIP